MKGLYITRGIGMLTIKKMFSFIIVFLFVITGCSNNSSVEFNRDLKLNFDDFQSVLVTVDGSKVLDSNDKSLIKKIIKEINTSDKQFATEMEFDKGPEGMITLKGEKEVKISFFKESGRTIYGDYYIHTEFNFD
jgi:hypothetical protein